MGRITVFVGDDLNSQQLLKNLEKRKLPYEKISLIEQPSRYSTLLALENGPVVPQVFFNSRAVGGLDKCLKELVRWDHSSRFGSPLAKYEAEIAPAEDPEDNRLALSTSAYKVVDPPPAPIQPHTVVKLPAGRAAPLREATELMKDALPPMEDHKYKGVVYRNSFSGKDLLEKLSTFLEIGEEKALRFIQRLLKASILHHVDRGHYPDEDAEFQNTTKDFYQMQCFTHKDILNSYRVWPNAKRDCCTVVEDLMKRMSAIEMGSVDEEGLLDYKMARENPGYCVFEDAVCELQKFSMKDLEQLDSKEMTALALNIWWVMLRYAFLKVGIPTSEADRKTFMNNTKFYLAGETISLHEWIEVLRGNTRRKLNIAKRDERMLFAAFMGAHNGSTWSSPFARFTASGLEEALDAAAGVFCRDDHNVSLRRKDGGVKVSSIFKQYHNDFGKNDKAILTCIQKYSTPKRKEEIDSLLKGNVKLSYREPELGYHSSAAGPWYNQVEVKKMHEKKKRGSSKDELGGASDHLSLSSYSSNHSGHSWL